MSKKNTRQVNEVLEMKKREIAAEKLDRSDSVDAIFVEPPKDPDLPLPSPAAIADAMLEAKRIDTTAKKEGEQAKKEEKGLVTPDMQTVIEDDLTTDEERAREADLKLIKDLTEILRVPKTMGAVPVMSAYSVGMMRRYFILDVDGTAWRKGWALYKEVKGEDPVGYVDMVIHILDTGIPRLHRAVDWAPLN